MQPEGQQTKKKHRKTCKCNLEPKKQRKLKDMEAAPRGHIQAQNFTRAGTPKAKKKKTKRKDCANATTDLEPQKTNLNKRKRKARIELSRVISARQGEDLELRRGFWHHKNGLQSELRGARRNICAI